MKQYKTSKISRGQACIVPSKLILVGFLFLSVLITREILMKYSFDTRSRAGGGNMYLTSDQISSLPRSCQLLYTHINRSFGTTCGTRKYNPIADINKDKNVTLVDFSLFVANNPVAGWCETMLKETWSPCQLSIPCGTLYQSIQTGFSTDCTSDAYSSQADVNDDSYVNILDFSVFSANYKSPSWCTEQLNSAETDCHWIPREAAKQS